MVMRETHSFFACVPLFIHMHVRVHVRQISCKLLSYITNYGKMKCKTEKKDVGSSNEKEDGNRQREQRNVFLSIQQLL